MSINSSGAFSKHACSLILDSVTGVKGSAEYEVFAEVSLSVEVLLVGPTSQLAIQGKYSHQQYGEISVL